MFDLADLHPLIVHAPLVLIPVAIVFQLLHLLVPRAGLRIAAILLLAGGVGGAILATETGESAEHRTEQVSPGAEDISVSGFVPQTMAEGNLLETPAKLGELTRNLYAFLLLVEAGLLATTLPTLARFRRTAARAKQRRVGIAVRASGAGDHRSRRHLMCRHGSPDGRPDPIIAHRRCASP